MRTYVAVGFALVGLMIGAQSRVAAQDSVLAEFYGAGVHSYFSGQYQDAHEYLTTAIEQGSRDPRAFYFRGLAYARLGRPDEAKSDYNKGAELEMAGADRVYPVGTSLQRVQGRLRLGVERHRQKARLAARTRDMKAKAARYERLQNAEEQVLRNNPSRPEPAAAQDLVGEQPAPAGADLFASEEETPAPAPAAAAAATPEDTGGGGLFDDAADPMPEVMEEGDAFSGDDPFAEDDAGSNPFTDDAEMSDDSSDDSDPFADDPF